MFWLESSFAGARCLLGLELVCHRVEARGITGKSSSEPDVDTSPVSYFVLVDCIQENTTNKK